MTKTCTKCGVGKELDQFSKDTRRRVDGLKSWCKECMNENRRESAVIQEYEANLKVNLNGIIARWWSSINRRTINGSKPDWKNPKTRLYYLDKGIRLEMTRDEFAKFVEENWQKIQNIRAAGGVASIDRILGEKNYSIDNIRIIPWKENAKLARQLDRRIKRR